MIVVYVRHLLSFVILLVSVGCVCRRSRYDLFHGEVMLFFLERFGEQVVPPRKQHLARDPGLQHV